MDQGLETVDGQSGAASPEVLRHLIRDGRFSRGTAGQAYGYVQANLVILPLDWARDFARFCQLTIRDVIGCRPVFDLEFSGPVPCFDGKGFSLPAARNCRKVVLLRKVQRQVQSTPLHFRFIDAPLNRVPSLL